VDGMSWRVQVQHSTGYHYDGEVLSSYNEARITPLTDPDQLTIDANVDISPPARTYRYWDYWGALVHAFDVQTPHSHLTVTGRSLVETAASPIGATIKERRAGWQEVLDDATQNRYSELLAPTKYVPRDDALAEKAQELAKLGNPDQAALAAAEWVRDTLTYEPGVTRVSSSAIEAWNASRGVCQDFAHLTLALLRIMGIPSRYVSGYLHPRSDATIGETVAGESHAWIEWWAGNWSRFDPTNGIPVGEQHVVVARGRDYADVPPLKGIYSGGAAGDLEVTVELTRMA
jgi:transglutaminase-like putative cysteine protease